LLGTGIRDFTRTAREEEVFGRLQGDGIAGFFLRACLCGVESRRAKIVTSIAMLYDLESPVDFI
jgi:hypothetical protein